MVRRVAGSTGGQAQYVATLPNGKLVRVQPPGLVDSAAPWLALGVLGFGVYKLIQFVNDGSARGVFARQTRGQRVVYDRTLGGRAITLKGEAARPRRRTSVWSDAATASERGKSEAEVLSDMAAVPSSLSGSGGSVLPTWWPEPVQRTKVQSDFGAEAAQTVWRGISSARLSGRDPSLLDLQKLRQVCDDFGVGVSVPSGTERDAVMRSGVKAAVDAVESGSGGTLTSVSSARSFVSGLALDLGVEPERAATMLAAAVAAKCRGSILGATARLRAQDDLGAIRALKGMSRLLAALPPAEGSAELGLVADTLGPRCARAFAVALPRARAYARARWDAFSSAVC